jgi:hypothetical protein
MQDGFLVLLRAHDHVWLNREPLTIRKPACALLWKLALAMCGDALENVSTVSGSGSQKTAAVDSAEVKL